VKQAAMKLISGGRAASTAFWSAVGEVSDYRTMSVAWNMAVDKAQNLQVLKKIVSKGFKRDSIMRGTDTQPSPRAQVLGSAELRDRECVERESKVVHIGTGAVVVFGLACLLACRAGLGRIGSLASLAQERSLDAKPGFVQQRMRLCRVSRVRDAKGVLELGDAVLVGPPSWFDIRSCAARTV
jgi:hypothetical protein